MSEVNELIFNPTLSTDEIYRGSDTSRCLTDDLDGIENSIASMQLSITDISQDINFTKSVITSFADGWELYYGSSSTAGKPTVYRFGHIVMLSGVLKNTSQVTLNAGTVTIFTLPSGYAPTQNIYQVCNGSGMNKYLLSIWPDGKVNFSRYGTSSYQDVAAGSWFPFTATWMV